MIEHISLNGISPIKGSAIAGAEKTTAEITKSFGDFLNDALSNVAAQEANVNKLNDMYLAGKVDATEVLIAANQSQLSLQLTSEIRNKVVAAYQEIMRIQV